MSTLHIKNLHAEVAGKEILKGITLDITDQELVAILGPNGHGKSTLLNVIMGHPFYKVTEGSIYLDDRNLLELTTDERAKVGLFLGMQNPIEVPGVNNTDFLRTAINVRRDKPISTYEFYKLLNKACEELHIPFELSTLNLNEGFSGGEKKRNEILQLTLLNPKFAMLDEIDSGLDVDAINIVSSAINNLKEKGTGFVIVSHYARLYDLIKPTRAIVIVNGRVAIDGDPSVIKRIDESGYEFIKTELGIDIEKEDPDLNKTSIGTCGVRESLK